MTDRNTPSAKPHKGYRLIINFTKCVNDWYKVIVYKLKDRKGKKIIMCKTIIAKILLYFPYSNSEKYLNTHIWIKYSSYSQVGYNTID